MEPVGRAMRSLEVPPNACGRVWNAQMRKISRKSAVALRAPSKRWDVRGWAG